MKLREAKCSAGYRPLGLRGLELRFPVLLGSTGLKGFLFRA